MSRIAARECASVLCAQQRIAQQKGPKRAALRAFFV
jgi:hypothetical protein